MKKWLILIIIFALILRLIFLMAHHDDYFNSGRMIKQFNIAENISLGNGFVINKDFVQKAVQYNYKLNKNVDYFKLKSILAPYDEKLQKAVIDDAWGYGLLLGLIWSVIPIKTYIVLQILQVVFDSLMCYFIFKIAYYLFKKEKIALLSSLFYAAYVPFIYLSLLALRDIYASWGLILGTFFFIKGLVNNRLLYYVASGLMVAVFSWFRPTIFLVPAAFFIYLFIRDYKNVLGNLKKVLIIMSMVILMFVLPFGFIYYSSYGTFNFTSGIGGANLWEGLGEHLNPYGFVCKDEVAFQRAKELGYTGDPSTPEYSKILKEDALRVIKEHPEFYAKVLLLRLKDELTAPMLFGIPDEYSYKKFEGSYLQYIQQYPLIFILKVTERALGIVLPILGLCSLLLFRERFREITILPLVYLYKVFVHLPAHFEPRYILEGYFPILILVAAGVVGLHGLISRLLTWNSKGNKLTSELMMEKSS